MGMSIRLKIIAVVLPLLVASVVLAAASSYFLAAAAVTRVARDFLTFKAEELESYARSQWDLLVENDMVGRTEMEDAARAAVSAFARSLLRSPTEAIFALQADGSAAFIQGPLRLEEAEGKLILEAAKDPFGSIVIGNSERVLARLNFAPFNWELLITEERGAFYGDVEAIGRRSLEILLVAVLASIVLLVIFTGFLTKPAEDVVAAMRRIIDSNDLGERVPVVYKDEIGQVSHTFNIMLEALGEAHEQIKRYAFDAVVAQKKEMKIRNIFQLYVPKDVIEQIFINPERMLVGDNRVVSILFSDIRSFTTISERMAPNELVASLNRYFGLMVDIIMEKNGVVDKFIGDAIMAIFGAPVSRGNDALSSVLAGLEMSEALDLFNQEQKQLGAPEFRIGVGINYGEVTVGNIGCEKKMNYTVIGDMVNLASRLEGLTKMYKEPILVTEGARLACGKALPFRMIDKVAVKGKTEGVKIYTTRRSLKDAEAQGWKLHQQALDLYYRRNFKPAAELFTQVLSILADDHTASLFLQRARAFALTPPGKEWDGVEIMTEK
ncbi:hypothetical protein MASR2M78_26110 [Treponema sp.]